MHRDRGTSWVAEAAVGGSTTPQCIQRHIQRHSLEGDRGKDKLSGLVQSLWVCVGALWFLQDMVVHKIFPQTNWQPQSTPSSKCWDAALSLVGVLHRHWGIPLFKGSFEFTLLPLLTWFTKPQRRTQSNRITSWVRQKWTAACKIAPLRQERGNVCKYFLLLPRISQIGRVGVCSYSYWGFFAILLENHSWLPVVWDIAESDLNHVNVTRIMIANLGGTLYAIQVHLTLQPPWIWICFLIVKLLLVLPAIYSTIFLLQYFSNSF